MHPVHEHSLRRWITRVIGEEGYSLKRTSPGDPNFQKLGRWSRWEGLVLVESNVDLEDLGRRCAAHQNAEIPRRDALKPLHGFEPISYNSDYIYKPPPEAPKPAAQPLPPDPQGSLF